MTCPTSHEIEILAKTIFGEARGEYDTKSGGLASLIAIANVVMNRVNGHTRYGNDIRSVCLKPFQFSCWNDKGKSQGLQQDHHLLCQNQIYHICRNVASQVGSNQWPDLTKGSTHYHAYHITPKWASLKHLQLKVGRHIFYRLDESGPAVH